MAPLVRAVTGSVTKKTYTITNEGDVKEEKILTPEEKAALVTTINSKIGKTVQYSVTPTGSTTPIRDWQVFYADEANNEVFIITKDIIETNTPIGGTSDTSEDSRYSSGPRSSSLDSGTYGRKYNSIWLGITKAGLNGTIVNNNAKSVAYLSGLEIIKWQSKNKSVYFLMHLTTGAPNVRLGTK